MSFDQSCPDRLTRRPRRWWGWAIVVFWVVMMAALVWREGKVARPASGEGIPSARAIAQHWQDGSEYFVIKLRETTVGAAVTTMTRVNDPSPLYLIEAAARATPSGNMPWFALAAELGAELNADFHLQQFWAAVELPMARLNLRGRVEFPHMLLEVLVGDQTDRRRYRLERPIVLANVMQRVLVRAADLRPGQRFSYQAVDPLWNLSLGTVEVEIGQRDEIFLGGEKLFAYPVTMRWGDWATTLWVDSAGRTLRQQLVGAVVLERASADEVRRFFEGRSLLPSREPLEAEMFAEVPAEPLTQKSFFGLGAAPSAPPEALQR